MVLGNFDYFCTASAVVRCISPYGNRQRKVNRHKMKVLAFVLLFLHAACICASGRTLPADTIKLMTYNVGNFGKTPSSQCPLFDFNLKSACLRTILAYEKPDIIGMTKIDGDEHFCTSTLINYVLDSVCDGCWGYGVFSEMSGYQKENMLYFNTAKFGLAGSTVIYSADPDISDISLHKLFYKTPDLAAAHDTVFLRIVLAHLLSGPGQANARAAEVAGAMNWLNTQGTSAENVIFMGDLNTTSSFESCFQYLVNSLSANTKFHDPPGQLGYWSDSPAAFAHYLTQSTRTSDPGDCSATGGLGNRFDHILITAAIKNGSGLMKYVLGTYKVVGQDGNHTGKALIDPPDNTSVPGNVNTALYFMSEHLPVILKLAVNSPGNAGIVTDTKPKIIILCNSLVAGKIIIKPSAEYSPNAAYAHCKAIIYGMRGNVVSTTSVNLNQANVIDISIIPKGIYLLAVKTGNGTVTRKFIKE